MNKQEYTKVVFYKNNIVIKMLNVSVIPNIGDQFYLNDKEDMLILNKDKQDDITFIKVFIMS